MNRIAIDPGDKHVGWAYVVNDEMMAGEWSPMECCNELVHLLTHRLVDEIVVEEFVLYEWETKKQAWSSFQTPQLIGAIKLIAMWFRIPVVEQGAYVKKVARKKMKATGVEYVGQGIHARDAQEHLYYRIGRSKV